MCNGQRSFDRRGWHLALGPSAEPKTVASELAYRAAGSWRVAQLGTVPGTPGEPFHPLTASSAEVDADGTVVFVASWSGNVDQANHIGRGIYRLLQSGSETVVDAFSVVPGQAFRFNAFGPPDIEQGEIVFWGGRDGGQWSGLYLWRQGRLRVVADQSGAVAPLSGGDLRGQRVAFQGQDRRGPAMFVWQADTQELTRLFGRGDAMPDRKRAEFFFDVALGEQIAAFGVGYDSVTDQRGIHMQRRILGWHAGAIWVVVDPAWFAGPKGETMHLEPIPVVDRDSVAFRVHAGRYVEAWVATGCSLERVSKSGDQVGGKEVRDFATLERESFTNGRIDLLANFTDGSQGYVRAARQPPSPGPANSPQPTPAPLPATAAACPLTAALYVTDVQSYEILRMTPDGKNAQVLVSGVDASDLDLDVAGRKMYWPNRDRDVMRANLDGSSVEVVHQGLPSPYGLALDLTNQRIFWTNQLGDPRVQSSTLTGQDLRDLVPGKADCMIGIAVDPKNRALYWMDGYYRGHVFRAFIDGGNPKAIATTVGIAQGVAVDSAGGKVYWSEYGNNRDDDVIRRANLDGSEVQTLFDAEDGLSTPQHIALDRAAGKIYWTDLHAGRVQRANLDGTGLETIRSGMGYPRGIALLQYPSCEEAARHAQADASAAPTVLDTIGVE